MRRLLLAAALSLAALPALAQDRTIRVISGFAAGGAGLVIVYSVFLLALAVTR